jgi:hypothetical protein
MTGDHSTYCFLAQAMSSLASNSRHRLLTAGTTECSGLHVSRSAMEPWGVDHLVEYIWSGELGPIPNATIQPLCKPFSKLGARLNVLGAVDPDHRRAETRLVPKRNIPASANTRVFPSLTEAGAALQAATHLSKYRSLLRCVLVIPAIAEKLSLVVCGIQPRRRGSTTSGHRALPGSSICKERVLGECRTT